MSVSAPEAPARRPASSDDIAARALAVSRRRGRLVSGVTAIGVVVTFWLALDLGSSATTPSEILRALTGSLESTTATIIRELRLPRAVAAVVVGVGLALSGAIFQSLARNPLASPDILGITAGASAAAVFAISVWHSPGTVVALVSVAGGLAAVVLIYALAYRRGVSIQRLVLVGVGIGATCQALTEYLIATAETTRAVSATTWLTGSLNSIGWRDVAPSLPVMLVLLVVTRRLAQPLSVLQLGDDSAKGLGARVEPAKGALLLTAVALAGVATAVAGPVVFVAFVAPPIARRVTRAGTALLPTALIGALLVQVADLVGHHTIDDVELPVGVITGIIGAPYLLYLLARVNRGTGT